MQSRDKTATYDYLTRTFVREPEWLAPVRSKGEEIRPGMQLSPYEGYLLSWLATLTGARRILEIGTFMGYSALWMATTGAHITTLEFDPKHAGLARGHIATSPYKETVMVEEGDALGWLAAHSKAPTYDMVFVDAEKRSYMKYLDAAMPLLNPRALIVGDNTLLWDAVARDDPKAASAEAVTVMKKFNTTLADPEKFDGIMLPTTEGLTVARRR